jgi:hypothetical protein
MPWYIQRYHLILQPYMYKFPQAAANTGSPGETWDLPVAYSVGLSGIRTSYERGKAGTLPLTYSGNLGLYPNLQLSIGLSISVGKWRRGIGAARGVHNFSDTSSCKFHRPKYCATQPGSRHVRLRFNLQLIIYWLVRNPYKQGIRGKLGTLP